MKERIYLTFDFPGAVPGSKTLLTGVRSKGDLLYVTGFYQPPGPGTISFLFKGELGDIYKLNHYHILNYPSRSGAVATNLYGPYILKCGKVRVVGNYFTRDSAILGCMYEGNLDGVGIWTTLTPTADTINTIAHSTMKDLVVGNYDELIIQGKAFIYNIKTKIYTEIIYPNAVSITAYGVWYNGRNSYTICGGIAIPGTASLAYLVDYNINTQKFSNWRTYQHDLSTTVTHFNGITSDGCQGYYLTGDATSSTDTTAFLAHAAKNKPIIWHQIEYPDSITTSGNSVTCTTVIGVYKNSIGFGKTIHGYISILI